tara:strand:+ start:1312 stop:1500 length:189 start_codon:yes stop_codon:yes gene_type:complete
MTDIKSNILTKNYGKRKKGDVIVIGQDVCAQTFKHLEDKGYFDAQPKKTKQTKKENTEEKKN